MPVSVYGLASRFKSMITGSTRTGPVVIRDL
jgi:hypothetical protein